MSLPTGAQIGPYTIGEEIGSGGMGVVYRATDRNLKRDVAIKALPQALASDAERLARFQREAEVLASLNHPNIAQIYGLEKTDGATVLVMELVEGPTLADRIAKGLLPPDEALGVALQVADALEAAHSRNIVHRDLKPANIKLRPDHTVKVLDFGIAKAMEPESIRTEPQSPMLTTPATQIGVILGTAAYMSPEQARGLQVDQRTDIWAFGCLLFEMLTGQLAFGGEDVSVTLARVIANETNLDTLPAAVSPAVRRTIELCLQKDPRKRLHAMGDVRLALEGAFDTVSPQAGDAVLPAPLLSIRTVSMATAALAAGAAVAAVSVWLAMQPGPQPVNRFDYAVPEGAELRLRARRGLTVSPDGRHFVFNTGVGLQIRSMDSLEARVIPGTELPLTALTFSPDGQQVAYYDFRGELRRISVSGGASVVIAQTPSDPYDLNWQTDGTILVSGPEGISRVAASGGALEVIVPMPGVNSNGPQLLPDGETLLFSIGEPGGWDSAEIVTQSLVTGERKVIWPGGSNPRYLSTGHVVFLFDSGLFAIPFDADTLTATGGPVPLVQGIWRSLGETGVAQYDISKDGALVYVAGEGLSENISLLWVDRDGHEEDIAIEPSAYVYPRISPDGTRVVLDGRGDGPQLWIWDFAAETRTRLTIGQAAGNYPVWTSDSLRIAYNAGQGNIDWKAANDTGTPEHLATDAPRSGSTQVSPYFFTPMGDAIVFRSESNAETGDDIGMIATANGAEPEWLLAAPYQERNAELSPDGRWMAYESDESGRFEIYVRPFPDVEADRWQVSNLGGSRPLWSHDGTELFYLEPGSPEQLMSVAVELSGEVFQFGARTPVLEWPYVGIVEPPGRPYDISRDGQRFLVLREAGGERAQPHIVVVQNWFEELKQLAPLD